MRRARGMSFALFGILFAAPLGAAQVSMADSAAWPVQADGRVKPLDTMAQETLRYLSGRTALDGRSGVDLFWYLSLGDSDELPVLRVDDAELKERLGDATARRFSFRTVYDSTAFREIVEAAMERRGQSLELSALQTASLELYDKLSRLQSMKNGEILSIVPRDDGREWERPDHLAASPNADERELASTLVTLRGQYAALDGNGVSASLQTMSRLLEQLGARHGVDRRTVELEHLMNRVDPVRWAWVLYLVGAIVLVLWARGGKRLWAGLGLVSAAFLFHTAAIYLRWRISGRAPLSNMYESLAFMSWGAGLIGLCMSLVTRRSVPAAAGGLLGFLGLLFCQSLPIDASISPLVPVLANTAWLSIHVMTIMMAYSALALGMVIGHFELVHLVRRKVGAATGGDLGLLLYRMLLLGVLFLTAGIAFGAIWANQSWGRYWGWDPKETWSLITLFGYLVVVHARSAGWIGRFGTAALSVLGFQLVLMTYYGVNYVLAAGLHSYGFGSGGIPYFVGYLVLETVFLLAILSRRRASRDRSGTHEEVPGGVAGA